MASAAPASDVIAKIIDYLKKMEARQMESETGTGVVLNEMVDRLTDLSDAYKELAARVDSLEAMVFPQTGTQRSAENLNAAMDEIIAARGESESEPQSELDALAASVDEVDLSYVYGKPAPPPTPPPAQPPYTPEEVALMRGQPQARTPPPPPEAKAEAKGKPPGFFGKLLGKGGQEKGKETAPAGPQSPPQSQAPPPPTPPPRGVRDPTRIPVPEPKGRKKVPPKGAPQRLVSDAAGDALSRQPTREQAMRRLMKLQHLKDDKGVMK